MFIPWWRVGSTFVNPHMVMAVQFHDILGGDLMVRVYVDGRRLTAYGAEARHIRRLWQALTGQRRRQLGYDLPLDVEDNDHGEGDIPRAA